MHMHIKDYYDDELTPLEMYIVVTNLMHTKQPTNIDYTAVR